MSEEEDFDSEVELEVCAVHNRLSENAAVYGKQLKELRDATVEDLFKAHKVIRTVHTKGVDRTRASESLLLDRIEAIENAEQPHVNVVGPLGSTLGLTHFSGAIGADFNSWARTFEDVVNALGEVVDDGDKLKMLLAYLRDQARDKAAEIIEDNNAITFPQMIDALKTAFADPQRTEVARQCLRATHQEAGESVDSYAARVRKLTRSAYPALGREARNEKTLETFIDGLKADIRFHCKGDAPHSFDEALGKALRYEALLAECARSLTIAPSQVAAAQASWNQQSAPESQPPYQRNDRPYGQSSGRSGQFQNQGRNSYGNQRFNNRNQNGFSQNRNNQNQRARIDFHSLVCHNCKYTGHIRAFCPFPSETQVQPPRRSQTPLNPRANHFQKPNQMVVQVEDAQEPQEVASLRQEVEALVEGMSISPMERSPDRG